MIKKSVQELIDIFNHKYKENEKRMEVMVDKETTICNGDELKTNLRLLCFLQTNTKTIYQMAFDNAIYLELIAALKNMIGRPFDAEDLIKMYILYFKKTNLSNCIPSSTNQMYNLTKIWEFECRNNLITLLERFVQ